MTYRKLLAPLCADGSDPVTLEAAAIIADEFRSHIDALLVRPNISASSLYFGMTSVAFDIHDMVVDAGQKAWWRARDTVAAEFDSFVEKNNIAAAEEPRGPGSVSARFVVDESGDPDDIVVRARTSDLTIFTALTPKGLLEHRDIARILVESGRPVLATCQNGLPALRDLTKIGVAWDDSASASRALAAATPFLLNANAVDLVTVRTDVPREASTERAAEHLLWHGMEATARTIPNDGQSVGARLLDAARDGDWRMIVMGGYARSRFLEAMFGGVTKEVLSQSEIPVLLAH